MQLRLSSMLLHHHSGTIIWPDDLIAWKYLVTDLPQSHEPTLSFLLIYSSSKANYMFLINTNFTPDVNKYLEHSGDIIRARWNSREYIKSGSSNFCVNMRADSHGSMLSLNIPSKYLWRDKYQNWRKKWEGGTFKGKITSHTFFSEEFPLKASLMHRVKSTFLNNKSYVSLF